MKRGERDWLALDRVRQPDGEFLSYAEQCELRHPTRAQSVLDYINLALDAPPQRLPGNKGRPPRTLIRRQHPAKMAQRAREKSAVPDQTEREVQLMKHRLAQIVREAPQEHGLVEGPLRIAADHLAPQLQVAHGLTGEQHRAAIVEWLVGVWGECAHAFPNRPNLPGFNEWAPRG